MKSLFAIAFVLTNLINFSSSNAQVKTILDSKYHKYFIGFTIPIYANTQSEISICGEDSVLKVILFDSDVSQTEELVFILKGEQSNFEQEKTNYPENKVYPIPIDKSGIYYINVIYRQKIVLVN